MKIECSRCGKGGVWVFFVFENGNIRKVRKSSPFKAFTKKDGTEEYVHWICLTEDEARNA